MKFEFETTTTTIFSEEESDVPVTELFEEHLPNLEVSTIENTNLYMNESLPTLDNFTLFENFESEPMELSEQDLFTSTQGEPFVTDFGTDLRTDTENFNEIDGENFETTTFSDIHDSRFVVELEDLYETSTVDFKDFETTTSVFESQSTKGLMEIFKENLEPDFWEDLNVTMDNSTNLLSQPEINLANQTLCKWYLPTIEQNPKALGNVGIALWVLGFVITFTLMVLFAKQALFIYKKSHKIYRRHLFSITSIYVVIAILTSIGSGIPRAHSICSGVKDVYMCIGIGHFMDLTIAMYGGENVMAFYCRDKAVNMRSILLFKCCLCIPRCKVKKVSISILKWIVWQMKWSQAIYYLLRLIIYKSTENSLGVADPHSVQIWYLQILNVLSFLSGVASLLIVKSLVVDDLQERYNYNIKAKLVRFTILVTKLQRLIFDILGASDVFPCYPPYVSQKFYKNVLKDFIYLIEVLILGILTFVVYNRDGEFEYANSKEIPRELISKPDEVAPEEGDEEDDRLEKNGNVDSRLIVSLEKKFSHSLPESNC